MATVQMEVRKAVLSRPSTRIEALDWTKGALILCMVIYHGINYSAFRPVAFRYLSFLPPSFILITGFLVGQIYVLNYNLNSWKPYLRLFVRGAKLLAIFAALNLAHCIALQKGIRDGIYEFADRSEAMFLSGNGREGIFEVLLPISYFLLIAPVLLWLRSRALFVIALAGIAVFGLCMVLEWDGNSSKNLELLSSGTIGMAIGLIPMAAIDEAARKRVPAVVVYTVYRVLGHFWWDTYPVQVLAAVATVFLLYTIAVNMALSNRFWRPWVIFGKYSLVGYLAQIGILQAIVLASGGRPTHPAGVLLNIVAAAILTFLLVIVLNEARRRSSLCECAYKAVFA